MQAYDEEMDKVDIRVVENSWERLEQEMVRAAEKTVGRSTGRKTREQQTWWWNEAVAETIKAKARAYKRWRRSRSDEDKVAYSRLKKEARRQVAKAKEAKRRESVEQLELGKNEAVFKMAKQCKKDGQEVTGVPCIQDENGVMTTITKDRLSVWSKYCDKLMNTENEWDGVAEADPVEGPCEEVKEKEVWEAVKMMKRGKAAGPSEVCTEMLTTETCVRELTKIANGLLAGDRMPASWKLSTVIPVFKGKGNALICGNYRTIKLLEHAMKVLERVFERRLRQIVKIREEQYGFMPGRGTTDAIFVLRQLQEKYLANRKELFMLFIDLEKAFDRVPRKLIEFGLRKKGVPEVYVRAVKEMYKDARSFVSMEGVRSEVFPVKVGVHQGSVLSPLLFAILMDVLTEEVAKVGKAQMFADDLVLACETKEEAKERFLAWREALESRGLKVNMGKTKMLKVTREAPLKEAAVDPCGVCGKRVGSNSVQCRLCNKWVHGRCSGTRGSLKRIAGVFECKVCKKGGRKQLDQFKYDEVELECVGEFCYLGDMLNDKGGVERAAIARVKSAWLKFRSLSGILCTRGMSWKMKGLVYKVCVRSVLTYGAETWAMKADVLARLRGTERRMMRMMTGVSLRDRVQSTEIGAKLGVNDLEERVYVGRDMFGAWMRAL